MQNKFGRMFAAGLLAGATLVGVVTPLSAQDNAAASKKGASATMPKVGDMAPDFKLKYVEGEDEKEVTLSQFRGKKNVVLAFYIFAFTGG